MWHRRALVLLIKIMLLCFNLDKAEVSATPTEVTRSYLCSALVRIFYLNISGFRLFQGSITNRSVICHFV